MKDSPHLFEVIETKKRLAKSHETSSPQPPKSKKRKVVKRGLEVSASSSQPIEVEEVIHLDAKETTQALTIYTSPISSTLEETSTPFFSTSLSPEIQIDLLSLPIIESRPLFPPHLTNLNEDLREELPPSPPHLDLTLSSPRETTKRESILPPPLVEPPDSGS